MVGFLLHSNSECGDFFYNLLIEWCLYKYSCSQSALAGLVHFFKSLNRSYLLCVCCWRLLEHPLVLESKGFGLVFGFLVHFLALIYVSQHCKHADVGC